MTREQQYWEDTQEALSRVFDRCEEIDPQSGYDMLEDIQFIRGFINKCKPRTEKQEPILDKIRDEIKQTSSRYVMSRERGYEGQVEWSDRLIKESEVLGILDKYKAETEDTDGTNK